MTQFLTARATATLASVAPSTIRSYQSRKQMPQAQACPACGSSPVWEAGVIDEWVAAKNQSQATLAEPASALRTDQSTTADPETDPSKAEPCRNVSYKMINMGWLGTLGVKPIR